MFGKNLKFYRLRSGLTQQELAERVGIGAMAISNYEKGKRQPNYQTVIDLADKLGVAIGALLSDLPDNEELVPGNFRDSGMTETEISYVEEYITRSVQAFLAVSEWLGMPRASNNLKVKKSASADFKLDLEARNVRQTLGVASQGPIGNIVSVIENLGIFVVEVDDVGSGFSGYATYGIKSGLNVLAINKNMSPVRKRFTLVHEFIHILYDADETVVDDIAGRVLLPTDDLKRELGYKRNSISYADISFIHDEYGVSAACIAYRAYQEGIISRDLYYSVKDIRIGNQRIPDEYPTRLKQLVCRAVNEKEIGISKAAELLGVSYSEAEDICYGEAAE